MLEATIDLELSSAIQALDNVRRKQLPFATAVALTKTAQAAQTKVKAALPTKFTIRSPFLERGVRIKPASKRTQRAEVMWRGPAGNRQFASALARQDTGGLKRPTKRYLAIPRDVKRGKGGRVTKANRPGALVKRRRVFIGQTRKPGTLAIYQRVGRGTGPPKVLYLLTPKTARIEETGWFVDVARTEARRVFKREFGKAFAKAIRTAR